MTNLSRLSVYSGLVLLLICAASARPAFTQPANIKEIPPDWRPRLDDVTLYGYHYNVEGDSARMILMAHGANFAKDADILIYLDGKWVKKETEFSRQLQNDLQGIDPTTLGYPILHYATVWTTVTVPVKKEMLKVKVCNYAEHENDDACTAVLPSDDPESIGDYKLPMSLEKLDSDGDGLYDAWECNPYSNAENTIRCDDTAESVIKRDANGNLEVRLPQANRYRKDLFVQVNWMKDPEKTGWSGKPHPDVWRAAKKAFANAPVLNSDGSTGITLHLDTLNLHLHPENDEPDFAQRLWFKSKSREGVAGSMDLEDFKERHFDPNRTGIYRYALFGWASGGHVACKQSGYADPDNDNFFVSLFNVSGGNRADLQAGTFLHELGHVLGLGHGGKSGGNSKDNYNSIMQYGNNDAYFDDDGVSIKPSPAQFSGIDTNCRFDDAEHIYTYSQGMRKELNEANLDERIGVCNGLAKDWNGDGDTSDTGVAANLDEFKDHTKIKDHADWRTILKTLRVDRSPPPPPPPTAFNPHYPKGVDAPPTPALDSSVLQLPKLVKKEVFVKEARLPTEIDLGFALERGGEVMCHDKDEFTIVFTDTSQERLPFKVVASLSAYSQELAERVTVNTGTLVLRLPDEEEVRFDEDVAYLLDYTPHTYGAALGYEVQIVKKEDRTLALALGRVFGKEAITINPIDGVTLTQTADKTVSLTFEGADSLKRDLPVEKSVTFEHRGEEYNLFVLQNIGSDDTDQTCSSQYGLEYVIVRQARTRR